MIDPVQNKPAYRLPIGQQLSSVRPQYTLDRIRSAEPTPSFSKRVVGLIFSVYRQLKRLFAKLLFCFEILSPEEKLAEYLEAFRERAKQGDRSSLRLWWQKAFDSLPLEMRKKILLAQIECYAHSGSDKIAFARENYDKYHTLARQFIFELEIIEGRDPVEHIPTLLEKLI